jgi:dipeptidyl-peptidase-4
VRTGRVHPILVEKDEAWVDTAWGDIDWDKTGIARGDVEWIDGGKRFLWASERDGWRHIYSISRDGADVKTITPANYDVITVERVDTQNGFSTTSHHRQTPRSVTCIACASTAAARMNG